MAFTTKGQNFGYSTGNSYFIFWKTYITTNGWYLSIFFHLTSTFLAFLQLSVDVIKSIF